MANSVAEIKSAKSAITGGVSFAPKGTAVPVDARTALNAAFKGLGLIGADGIVPSREISTDPVKDMNGDTVYTLQTDASKSYQVEFLQSTNVDLKKVIFGESNVTVTAATSTTGKLITVEDRAEQQEHGVLSIDVFDGKAKHREVAEDIQVTAVEEGPMVSTAVRSYTLTFTAYKNADGVYVTTYDDDGEFTA